MFGAQILGVRPSDSAIVALEQSSSDYSTIFERIGISIVPNTVVTINRVYPKIKCSVTVNIQIGSQDKPDGAVTWTAARTFNPNTQRNLPMKAQGMYICYRISSIGSYQFTFSGISFDYEITGDR